MAKLLLTSSFVSRPLRLIVTAFFFGIGIYVIQNSFFLTSSSYAPESFAINSLQAELGSLVTLPQEEQNSYDVPFPQLLFQEPLSALPLTQLNAEWLKASYQDRKWSLNTQYNPSTASFTPEKADVAFPLPPKFRTVTSKPVTDPSLGEATIQARARFIHSYTPSIHCPFQERVGSYGDGGKWLCMPRTLLTPGKCIIYSFGSRLDVSFEMNVQQLVANIQPNNPEIVLSQLNKLNASHVCEVHVFDPTPSVVQGMASVQLPPNTYFHPWALGAKDQELVLQNVKITEIYPLDEIVARLGHDHIDVLKVDIEGSEFPMIRDPSASKSNSIWRSGRIGQLQLEVHLTMDPAQRGKSEQSLEFSRFMHALEYEMNFRVFHTEVNEDSMDCWEFAFVQSKNLRVMGALQKKYSISQQLAMERDAELYRIAYRNSFYGWAMKDVKDNAKSSSINYDKVPFLNWFHDASVACQNMILLGDLASSDGLFWCMDPFTTRSGSSDFRVLSLVDAVYGLAGNVRDGKRELSWPSAETKPVSAISPRNTWQRHLVQWKPNIVLDLFIASFAGQGIPLLKSLQSQVPCSVIHLSLDGRDEVAKIQAHLPALLAENPSVQLLFLDLHFCNDCTSSPQLLSEPLLAVAFERLVIRLQKQGYWLYYKICRLPLTRGGDRADLGHYLLHFMKRE